MVMWLLNFYLWIITTCVMWRHNWVLEWTKWRGAWAWTQLVPTKAKIKFLEKTQILGAKQKEEQQRDGSFWTKALERKRFSQKSYFLRKIKFLERNKKKSSSAEVPFERKYWSDTNKSSGCCFFICSCVPNLLVLTTKAMEWKKVGFCDEGVTTTTSSLEAPSRRITRSMSRGESSIPSSLSLFCIS